MISTWTVIRRTTSSMPPISMVALLCTTPIIGGAATVGASTLSMVRTAVWICPRVSPRWFTRIVEWIGRACWWSSDSFLVKICLGFAARAIFVCQKYISGVLLWRYEKEKARKSLGFYSGKFLCPASSLCFEVCVRFSDFAEAISAILSV